jgi:lipoprotein NlpI
MQLGPKSVIVLHNWRGNAYYAAGDYDRAIQDYSQAIQLDPKSAVYLSNRGNAYADKGDYDSAIKDFDKAIELNPKSSNVYSSKGFAFARKGDYDSAIKYYSQAIQLGSTDAPTYNGRGDAYLAKADYMHAIQDYDDAIRNNPSYAEAFFGRGKAYFAERNYDHAVQDFSKTIALQQSNAGAYWDRALAELYWDKPGSAADDLAAAVKLAPTHAYVAIWLHIARMRAGENDAGELAANAQKLDKTKWPWPVVALFLGSATAEAVRTGSQSADDPSTRKDQLCEADFYLGVYHGAKGDQNDARQLLQSAALSCPRGYVEYETAGLELDRLH